MRIPNWPLTLLSQGGAASVVDMLVNGQVDLCLTSPDPQLPEVEWTPLWSERLVLVGVTGTAAGRPIHLREVKDRPFVALKPGYGLRQITDELCAPGSSFEVLTVDLRPSRDQIQGPNGTSHAPAPHAREPV